MTPARTKSKTVKKKPAAARKKKPVIQKPAAKKTPSKPVAAKPAKKKPVPATKADTRSSSTVKKDVKKPAALPVKATAPPAKNVAAKAVPGQAPGAPNAQRAKKAPKVRPSRAREPGKRPDLPLPTPVERPGGAAGQLGEKHVCFSCGAKFYDLGKPEPLCPKCGANQREAPRQVRTRAPATPEPAEKPVKRSRLLDEDEEEIVIDTDAEPPDGLDLGLGVVDDAEDFGEETVEEEEEEEVP